MKRLALSYLKRLDLSAFGWLGFALYACTIAYVISRVSAA